MENTELELNNVWRKRYKIAKFFVYFIFIIGLFYGLYLILFPSASFTFSFRTPDSLKNTVVNPRDENGNLIKNGEIGKDNGLIFDTNPIGDFSEVIIKITMESNSEKINNGSISLRKSYRAFFYPEGKNLNDSENINPAKLLSNGISAYLESNGKLWPINNTITFESMGFEWNDVSPASSEEIGSYEKQKLFTISSPHPDGTVFFDEETGKYYLVENGEKRELIDVENLLPKLKMNPIIADTKALEKQERCQLENSFGFIRSYICTIPIEKIQSMIGNDYQFEANFGNSVKIGDLNITFKKAFNTQNLLSSLATLKNRITTNYYGQNK
ncbi:MAG: hypothetical protein V1804_04120 [Patescibacteria group bacterium]